MYNITIRSEFCAAHRLQNHSGKCKNLHGHNWIVEVTLQSEHLNAQGMVVDFSDAKRDLKALLEKYDHKVLVCVLDATLQALLSQSTFPYAMLAFEPTAENMARFLGENTAGCSSCRVWETEANMAEWSRNV